tara:strand:+ start:1011 stop:1670 length:660 start_codon:yes stop_codon:yes gene_type:complete
MRTYTAEEIKEHIKTHLDESNRIRWFSNVQIRNEIRARKLKNEHKLVGEINGSEKILVDIIEKTRITEDGKLWEQDSDRALGYYFRLRNEDDRSISKKYIIFTSHIMLEKFEEWLTDLKLVFNKLGELDEKGEEKNVPVTDISNISTGVINFPIYQSNIINFKDGMKCLDVELSIEQIITSLKTGLVSNKKLPEEIREEVHKFRQNTGKSRRKYKARRQ